jgi:phospholipid/cholesterol/gamma-HCH transport system substrate-binding protein
MAIQDLTPQLRTRLQRVEKIVGMFVLVAILALVVGFGFYLHHMAELKGWFIQKCPYFTFVESAEGLKIGDPVVLMGFEVGKITTITAESPEQHRVFVGFEVRRPYYGYIWSDSKVRIAAAGLLGSRQLEITPGETGEATAYEEGGLISELRMHSGARKPFAEVKKGVHLDPDEEPSLSDQAQVLVGEIKQALPGILSQVTTVLTNTAQLTANANQIATNMVIVTANLRDPNGSLGQWVLTPEMQTNLNANLMSLDNTLLNLAAITSNLNTQVATNNTVLSNANKLVADTDNLVQGLKKHWLLRGVFQKMNSQTNAVPANVKPPGPAK